MSDNNQKKERDIWSAQALKSFVKAKTDWFNGDDFDSRLHLSFVEHSGKPEFNPVKTIEIGVPMVKAGSDGDKRTGVTALGLCQMIANGTLARMCAAERKAFEQRKAEAHGAKVYQQPIWACIGGTTSQRAKDGKSEFRKIEILPGQKDGTYAFRAASCEGETNNQLGGVQPKKGAPWTQIIVPVDGEYLYAFAVNTIAEWNAQQVVRAMNKVPYAPKAPSEHEAQPAAAENQAHMAQQQAVNAKAEKPACVWAFYDRKFFGPMGCAITPEDAVTCANRCLSKLQKERNLRCRKSELEKLYNELLNGKEGADNTANMWLTPLPLFLTNNSANPEQSDDELFVMVFHSVV